MNAVLRQHKLDTATTRIGTLNRDYAFRVKPIGAKVILEENLSNLRAVWSDVTRRIAGAARQPRLRRSRSTSSSSIRPIPGSGRLSLSITRVEKSVRYQATKYQGVR